MSSLLRSDGAGAAQGPDTTADRQLFGWRVRSKLALGELLPWDGDDRDPDVIVTVASVPDHVEDEIHHGPFLRIGRDGLCLLTVPDVARFRIVGGHSVTIDPQGAARAADIKIFLLGSVLGILCHQRGLLPLHASAVEINGHALAFAGISGSGKSSLAAMLSARGHRLLADDLTVIDPKAPGGPMLLPGFPRMKLWKDSLERLGVDAVGLQRVREPQDKFLLTAPAFDPTPVRLSSIYGLVRTRGPIAMGIEPLSGRDAVALLSNNVSRAFVTRLIGDRASLFEALMQLARGTRIWTLTRSNDLRALDELAQRVESHAAASLS